METTVGELEMTLNEIPRAFKARQCTAWIPLLSAVILIGLSIWAESVEVMHNTVAVLTTVLNVTAFYVGVFLVPSSLWCDVG